LLQFVPSQNGISATGSLARNKECPVFLQSVYLVDKVSTMLGDAFRPSFGEVEIGRN
jgi:hypothetical protein